MRPFILPFSSLKRHTSSFRQQTQGTRFAILYAKYNAGLSILCKGSRDTKVYSAFQLYDYDGDGFISLEEMENYLTNVFKILFHTTPEVRKSMGVTAEELGKITAESCFKECDLNNDKQLSFDEFKLWYSKPSLMSANFVQATEQLSVEEIQQITTLAQQNVSDVLSQFEAECFSDGTLSLKAFQEVLTMYASDDSHIKRVQALASTLYSLFDTNNDGVVDCTEIASGAFRPPLIGVGPVVFLRSVCAVFFQHVPASQINSSCCHSPCANQVFSLFCMCLLLLVVTFASPCRSLGLVRRH